MSFGLSAAWWGLLGLVVPILVHLLSKQKKTIIPFGSIRFLESQESNSASSIQLSQYTLLAIRCALLGLICLLMARPFYLDTQEKNQLWIEQSIYTNQDLQSILDSIPENTQIHQFSYGDKSDTDIRTFGSAWTLIDYLNRQGDTTEVWSHSFKKDFKGVPVVVKPHIDWRILPQKQELKPDITIESATTLTQWAVHADEKTTKFELIEESKNESNVSSVTMKISYSDNLSKELKSVLIEIAKVLPFDIAWVNPSEAPDWMITSPDDTLVNAKTILYVEDVSPLSLHQSGKDQYQITGQINQDQLLESNLPVQLAGLLANDYIQTEQYDQRIYDPTIQKSEANQMALSSIAPKMSPVSLNSYWWLAVLFLIVVERWVSYKSKMT